MAAHDLCVAGYAVHVYEMTDRLGGMMIWGIPAFRLPPGIIDEDVDRLMQRCPGLEVHLDTALGREVSLGELKERHDAVLLTIGAWWGKPMGIPGEEDERVVDGVGFLRRVNAGERPEMPETVVVVGGGDVAMDACRVAKRLPGCKHVKVIYRRGPGEIPARKIELHHAIKEDVEFLYHTQQVAVVPRGNQLALKCVKTALGEPDDDGRRRPVAIEGSEHEILCGSVIAAVGQRGICEELDRADMMAPDRVRTEWDSMRTSDRWSPARFGLRWPTDEERSPRPSPAGRAAETRRRVAREGVSNDRISRRMPIRRAAAVTVQPNSSMSSWIPAPGCVEFFTLICPPERKPSRIARLIPPGAGAECSGAQGVSVRPAGRMGADRLLVELRPPSRPGRELEVSVLDLGRMGHEIVLPRDVVDVDLHDPEVRDRGAEVGAHQGGEVPVEVVRGDIHPSCASAIAAILSPSQAPFQGTSTIATSIAACSKYGLNPRMPNSDSHDAMGVRTLSRMRARAAGS